MITSTSRGPGGSPLAASAAVPLSFIATGMVAVLVGTAWLTASPATLALPHIHPHVVALAHLWLLGGLLTICFGAVYQLLPVIANTAFVARKTAWAHLAVHTVGTTTMVVAFVGGQFGWVALGGGAVSVGVGLFANSVAQTLRAAPRLDPILLAFGAATAWLVATVLAGVLLAANLHFGWWSMDVLALLRAHAHLGVAGFFVTLLQGATFRLVPMFTLAVVRDVRRIGIALALSQSGLLLLTPGLALNRPSLATTGAGLLLISFGLTAVELRRCLAARKKRILEPGVRGFLLGLAFIAAAAVGGGALALGFGELNGAMAYAVCAVLGGVLGCIEGMLCKIVPFLVWMRIYGPRVGRQPTPSATSLGSAACERVWLMSYPVATVAFVLAILTGHEGILPAAAGCFAVAQVALAISLAKAARHLWRPALSPARVVAFEKVVA